MGVVDRAAGDQRYAQRTVNLSSYIGQTVPVSFTGVEGSIKQTSFVLDDIALTVS
ncbi:MAG: hypothetical protein QOE61_5401 [Micromonosporaceae bacterium]|nr:hypothetical protein [Micromonosporaceae bacterium]